MFPLLRQLCGSFLLSSSGALLNSQPPVALMVGGFYVSMVKYAHWIPAVNTAFTNEGNRAIGADA